MILTLSRLSPSPSCARGREGEGRVGGCPDGPERDKGREGEWEGVEERGGVGAGEVEGAEGGGEGEGGENGGREGGLVP